MDRDSLKGILKRLYLYHYEEYMIFKKNMKSDKKKVIR